MRKKRNNAPKQVTFDEPITQANVSTIAKTTTKPMTQQDRYQRLGLILNDD